MTNYITKRIQVIYRCVFKGILAYLVSGPKSLDFPELLLVFVEIIPDKVILDHKKLYLVYFENFHFLRFFHFRPIFAKNWKKWKFSSLTKYGQWPKPKPKTQKFLGLNIWFNAKISPGLFGISKIAGPIRSGLVRT